MNKGSSGLLGFVLILTLFGTYGSRSNVPSPGAEGHTKNAPAANTRRGLSESLPCVGDACMMEAAKRFICGSDATPNPVCTNVKESEGGTQFIIATLPDPTRTHLALFFDRMVDAIEQGIQDSGYLFDRSRMPWDAREHPESEEIVQRIQADDYQRARERWPGIMIFRRAPDQPVRRDPSCECFCAKFPKHVVVLVVGEFPTAGIHENQFQNALSVIRNIANPGPDRLRIIGPTFSGSLAGLPDLAEYARIVLATGSANGFPIYAFSGTVSSWKSTNALWSVQDDSLKFASFQQNDDYTLQAIDEYIKQLGFDIDKERAKGRYLLAVLSEDETAYGSQSPEIGKDYLQLYFPREISQLRSAYQGIGSEQLSSGNQPSLTLPLNLERTGGEEDTVTTYSSRQLPISQEAVLLGLVNELRANHARFVVLRATDPMDFLFLARYLRRAYPQGRIITLGSDLLFARDSQDNRLFGVLAATVYPQAPMIDGEFSDSNDVKTDRVFPSSFSTGLYNATRALLQIETATDNEPLAQDRKVQLSNDIKLYHYGYPRHGNFQVSAEQFGFPPLSLSALGQNGYWNVALLQPTDSKDPNAPVSTLPIRPQAAPKSYGKLPLPEEWRVFQVITFAWAILLMTCIWRASALSHEDVFSQFSRGCGDERSGVVALLGIATVLLLEIALWPDWSRQFASVPILYVLGLGLLLATVVTFGLDISWRGSDRWLRAFLIAALISIYAVLKTASPQKSLEFSYLYRGVHLVSGVSPILPLILLLGSVIWATWHTTTGTALLDSRVPILPALESVHCLRSPGPPLVAAAAAASIHQQLLTPTTPLLSLRREQAIGSPTVSMVTTTRSTSEQAVLRSVEPILEKENEALLELVKPNLSHPRIDLWLIAIGIGSVLLLDHYYPPLYTLEKPLFGTLVAVLSGLCILTLIGMTLRMRLLWKETKQLLVSLDSRPLRRGFTRIGGISTKPFQLGRSNEGDFDRLISREFEAAKCVMNRKILSADELNYVIKNLSVIRKPLPLKLRNGPLQHLGQDRELIRAFGEFQKAMANAVANTLMFLIPRWKADTNPVLERENADPSSKAQLNQEPVDEAVRAAEHFVCTHYVNFILMVLVRIRAFMSAIAGMYVLVLLALNVYPFEPGIVIRLMMAVLLVFIVAIAALVYGGMHRDATLSHVTDTAPGELGMDFWLRMTSFIVLPLFSLAAAAFPEFNRFLFSWLEPALQALK